MVSRKLSTIFTPKRRRILLKAIIILAGALLLTWLLQYRYFLNDAPRVWQFITERPLVFFYSALLMYFIILFFSAFTRGPFLAIGLVAAIILGVTYAHINKFIMRGTPLLPEDFQLATESTTLVKFIDFGGLVRIALAIILTIALALLLDYLTRRVLRRETVNSHSFWRRHQLVPRALTAAVACLLFMACTDFARNHQGQRYEQIPWLNSEFVAWNQVRNYNYNGFLLGFLYNWSKFELAEPDGYNKEEITNIADTYNEVKKTADATRVSLKKQDYNIVIILNESFYDTSIIKDYYQYEGDVTPELHKIAKKYPSGQMYSLDYGGGTANIEFEALTGLSNYWVNTVPYTDLIPKAGEIPSIATFAKKNGYATTAIHPFNGGMYKRNIALKNEGFDEFITELEVSHTEHDGNSQYINDHSAYQETLDLLNKSDQKQLVALITMQNHSPYNADIYDHHDFTITNMDDDPSKKSDIETYLQSLHNSDAYLGEFISALDQSDEPTVVLFFGDHSPGIFSRVNDHEDKVVRDLARLTPYFIYTNFDTKDAANPTGTLEVATTTTAENSDSVNYTTKHLPTTTPNCFTNTLYNYLNLKKPTLSYLLDEICTETPILTPAYFADSAPFKSTELSSYELVIYDILGGKKYWLSAAK